MNVTVHTACEYCGREFATNHALKIHCVKAHALEMDAEKAGFTVLGKGMTDDEIYAATGGGGGAS